MTEPTVTERDRELAQSVRLDAARAEGRREAIEECAKIADRFDRRIGRMIRSLVGSQVEDDGTAR